MHLCRADWLAPALATCAFLLQSYGTPAYGHGDAADATSSRDACATGKPCGVLWSSTLSPSSSHSSSCHACRCFYVSSCQQLPPWPLPRACVIRQHMLDHATTPHPTLGLEKLARYRPTYTDLPILDPAGAQMAPPGMHPPPMMIPPPGMRPPQGLFPPPMAPQGNFTLARAPLPLSRLLRFPSPMAVLRYNCMPSWGEAREQCGGRA